jgi:hypothetical protein
MHIQRDYLGLIVALGLMAAAAATAYLVNATVKEPPATTGSPTPNSPGTLTVKQQQRSHEMEARRLQALSGIRRKRAKAAAEAAAALPSNERCISNLRFRKVGNEWQQLGPC